MTNPAPLLVNAYMSNGFKVVSISSVTYSNIMILPRVIAVLSCIIQFLELSVIIVKSSPQ
jgi:hypothetical protein